MDELTGATLAADQWEKLHDEARQDHPDHEETDPDLCPVCYKENQEDSDD